MHVNITNVFILIQAVIVVCSTMVLCNAFASTSIKKGILWMLAFLGLSGIGIWVSVNFVGKASVFGGPIRNYIAIFACCCWCVAALRLMSSMTHSYSYEESCNRNRASLILGIISMVLFLSLFIFM